MPAPLRFLAGAVTAAALLGGCGLIGGDEPAAPRASAAPDAVAEGAGPSRERVQQYLDAMRAKDVRKGRTQLCPVLHPVFDQAATGPNGDFARHFTVPVATIVDVRARGGKQEVVASVTVSTGGRRMVRALKFTVARGDTGWCIDGEVPATAPGPAPSDSASAAP
ncbi:MAG TPA: hypothetical protein VHN18_02885 [Micromonosporaceae bacterium]|nr:hypothetical protein [Micromonosporaceae bacterium]